MQNRRNTHVERLNRYLPFSPSHDQIYEEYQKSADSMDLDTVALRYVENAVTAGAGIILLTGDAGHGKTHLCRRLIQSALGYDQSEARTIINTLCDGSAALGHRDDSEGAPRLRIHKDFSESPLPIAAKWIEQIAPVPGETIVICANEGRLRAVLECDEAGARCAELLKALSATLREGLASENGQIHIVNLNHQSVTGKGIGERSLTLEALSGWTSGTRWRTCTECASKDYCPIVKNRAMLAARTESDQVSSAQRIELLLSTLERLGVVITIRELLMTIAYLLTGGLRCEDVHARVARSKAGWQHEFAFYNLAFAAPAHLGTGHLKRLALLEHLSKLDPGLNARKSIDERIVNRNDVFAEGEIDLQFRFPKTPDVIVDGAFGIDDVIGNPRNRLEREAEAQFIRFIVRCLRRRAWFDESANSDADMASLGFISGREFRMIVEKSPEQIDQREFTKLKQRIIAGLHHIQGLEASDNEPNLDLVDPAFSNTPTGASVLADRIPASRLSLMSLRAKWEGSGVPGGSTVTGSVDWLDRHVVLRIRSGDGHLSDLLLDLMMFECIMRAARGHVATRFYESELRRITSFLGRIAQTGRVDSERISIRHNGVRRSFTIDNGIIQVGAG
jgi:hypothetical protein